MNTLKSISYVAKKMGIEPNMLSKNIRKFSVHGYSTGRGRVCQVLLFCLVFALLAPFGNVQAAEKADPNRWTKLDTGLELSYAAVHIMDWSQTRYGARHPAEYLEENPILGKHPHKDKIDLYFATTLIAHAAIAYYLPKHYTVFGIDTYPRNLWQAVWIGIEISAVSNNASIGVKYRF